MEAFRSGDFDAAAWVNEAICRKPEEQTLDEYASMLVLEFQVKQLELNNTLEEASVEAYTCVPQMVRDIGKVKEEADVLRNELVEIEMKLGGIAESAGKNVALLTELDRIKRNMELSVVVLGEADRFLMLSKQIESTVFTSEDIHSVAAQILEVRKSLNVLENIADFQDRHQKLAQFEKRLESHIRPKFVAAIRCNDFEGAQELSGLYRDIEQEDVMKEAYFETRREDLVTFWDDYNGARNPLGAWLPLFYERVVNVVTAEGEWCAHLFGRREKNEARCELAIFILDYFAKGIHDRVNGNARMRGIDTLVCVLDIFEHSCSVLRNLKGVLNLKVEEEDLTRAVMAPYRDFVDEYEALEREVLSTELDRMMPTRGDFMNTVSGVHLSIGKIVGVAESAVERCIQFTEMAESNGLIGALTYLFSSYVEELVSIVKYLEKIQKGQKDDEESGLISTDWSHVHDALKFLAVAESFAARFHSFESKLRAKVLSHANLDSVWFSGQSEKKEQSSALLKKLRENTDAGLMPSVEKQVGSLVDAAKSFVLEIIFSGIRDVLSKYGKSQASWWGERKAPHVLDPDLPAMKPDPSIQVTRVIEHLFALPHQLEPAESGDGAVFAQHWINVVAKATVTLLVGQILGITRLNDWGAQQLHTDISAFSNLLSALGVEKKGEAFVKLSILSNASKLLSENGTKALDDCIAKSESALEREMMREMRKKR